MSTDLWRPPYCPCCGTEKNNFFWKFGYFRNKLRSKRIQKYKCKSCGKYFSKQTFDITYRQRKSAYNEVMRLLCHHGMSFRGIADVLNLHRDTVMRHYYKYLSWARKSHQDVLEKGLLKSSSIQIDEMFHYYRSKKNKVSIAVAIRQTTREILDIYVEDGGGYIKRTAPSSVKAVALTINRFCLKANETKLITDAHPHYKAIFSALPIKSHLSFKRKSAMGLKMLKPINSFMSQIRSKLDRLKSKSRSLAQSREKLQEYLDIYIAFHNEYNFSG